MTQVGQLNAIKLTYYGDCGMNPNDNSFPVIQTWTDNGKLFPVSHKTTKYLLCGPLF